MTEIGHEYEDVSKFQQVGGEYEDVFNFQHGAGSNQLEVSGGEYAVIANLAVETTLPTSPIQSPSVSQSSHLPQASQTVAGSSNDDFDLTECVAYETTVHAPSPASISRPLNSN